jgi:hypothetical protein
VIFSSLSKVDFSHQQTRGLIGVAVLWVQCDWCVGNKGGPVPSKGGGRRVPQPPKISLTPPADFSRISWMPTLNQSSGTSKLPAASSGKRCFTVRLAVSDCFPFRDSKIRFFVKKTIKRETVPFTHLVFFI